MSHNWIQSSGGGVQYHIIGKWTNVKFALVERGRSNDRFHCCGQNGMFNAQFHLCTSSVP